MTFKALYSSENIRYNREERHNSFREKVIENEIKINKNTLKRYSREF